MTKHFYLKMAVTNMRHHARTYIPYLATCVVTQMMFYMMHALSVQKGIAKIGGSESLRMILGLGTSIIGIFSCIFLVYTNRFLMKRRKHEMGLYNVLGLEKRHIGRILFWEMLLSAIGSIGVGLGLGMLWNKLMYMILLKMIGFQVPLKYEIHPSSIGATLILFLGINLFTLIINYFHMRMMNPVELLKSKNQGEKEPKSKWLTSILGVISLSAGYIIALTTKSPLDAMSLFFVAVILVMFGTYTLFRDGSIVLLKALRRNKKIYYQSKYFISISSMIFRMRQNAMGLANICILSSAVLVVLSTTVALYIGVEDALHERYPVDVLVSAQIKDDSEALRLKEVAVEVADTMELSVQGVEGYWNDGFMVDKILYVIFTVEDYNRLTGGLVVLDEKEVLLYAPDQNEILGDTLKLGEQEFHINARIDGLDFYHEESSDLVPSRVLIVRDKDFVHRFGLEEKDGYYYHLEIQLGIDEEQIISYHQGLNERLKEEGLGGFVESLAASREGFLSVYGGLFFLGIFVGVMFLMITVLIIYYKQISEGFEDKERYDILQKVGIDRSDIKKTIRSQVLFMFFLPLGTTVIHIAAAFPMIRRLLMIFNLTNTALFLLATVMTLLVFTLVYVLVYIVTARVYYRIVERL